MEESELVYPGIRISKFSEELALYPNDLRDVGSALKSKIKKRVFKWDPENEGVVISFKRIEQKSPLGEIRDEFPEIYITI